MFWAPGPEKCENALKIAFLRKSTLFATKSLSGKWLWRPKGDFGWFRWNVHSFGVGIHMVSWRKSNGQILSVWLFARNVTIVVSGASTGPVRLTFDTKPYEFPLQIGPNSTRITQNRLLGPKRTFPLKGYFGAKSALWREKSTLGPKSALLRPGGSKHQSGVTF